MLQKISLALAIAQSTVYADDHDYADDYADDHEEATGWEFIFPDEVFLINYT